MYADFNISGIHFAVYDIVPTVIRKVFSPRIKSKKISNYVCFQKYLKLGKSLN